MKPRSALDFVLHATFALMLSSLQLGCSGSDRPETASASGKITLDGQPVAGASVMFQPMAGGRSGTAISDEGGIYRMSTYGEPNDGVVVGEHKVTVVKIGGAGASAITPPGDPNAGLLSNIPFTTPDQPLKEPKIEYLVPQKYGSAETSALRVTVPAEGSDQLNLDLFSK